VSFVVAAFAAYYLALSLAREDGPGGVFLALRNAYTKDDWIGRGLRCTVCMSCWTALLVAGLHFFGYDWPIWWLGLAGASVTIDKYWKR